MKYTNLMEIIKKIYEAFKKFNIFSDITMQSHTYEKWWKKRAAKIFNKFLGKELSMQVIIN